MGQEAIIETLSQSKEISGNVRKRAHAVSEALRSYVEDGIANETLTPGQRLPTERELMDLFGGGRNTIRKTLIALEKEGKIVRQVGSGTYIADDTVQPIAPLNASAASFLTEAVKSAGPLEVMELRQVFEPTVAELATKRASTNDAERIRKAYENSLKAKSIQEFEDCDDAFHQAIAEACHNTLFDSVHEIISAVRNETEWGIMKRQSLNDKEREAHSREHKEILDAILKRNPLKARQAMLNHLEHVSNTLFGPHSD